MILNRVFQHDMEAQSQTHDERICETRQEQTESRVPPGATENPGPPAGRRQVEHPRSAPPKSGSRFRWGCASWPA